MGQASEKDGNRNLTHILIPRDKEKGEVEFRAISSSLARDLLRSVDGNELLFQTILRGELDALQSSKNKRRVRSKKPKPNARKTQKQKESQRSTKGGRAKLLRTLPGPKAEIQATETGRKKVKQQFTPEEIMERAREIL